MSQRPTRIHLSLLASQRGCRSNSFSFSTDQAPGFTQKPANLTHSPVHNPCCCHELWHRTGCLYMSASHPSCRGNDSMQGTKDGACVGDTLTIGCSERGGAAERRHTCIYPHTRRQHTTLPHPHTPSQITHQTPPARQPYTSTRTIIAGRSLNHPGHTGGQPVEQPPRQEHPPTTEQARPPCADRCQQGGMRQRRAQRTQTCILYTCELERTVR